MISNCVVRVTNTLCFVVMVMYIPKCSFPMPHVGRGMHYVWARTKEKHIGLSHPGIITLSFLVLLADFAVGGMSDRNIGC